MYCEHISIIVRMSLEQEIVPSPIKLANILAIHNSKSKEIDLSHLY